MSGAKHPGGLYRLFFIEMWERLAFYTMLNVLLLYATDFERGGLALSSAEGNEIYGLYLAFVYFTPFPGGMLADRYLGYRKAVALGAVLMATGLMLMSIHGSVFFVSGLAALVLGNGFFKPNISAMVGNLYEPGDARRDAGFNIFYMGINIGAFAASFLSSAVRNNMGWLWTFRVAGVGLLIGTAILLASWKTLAPADRKPAPVEGGTTFGQVALKILLPAFGAGIAGYLIANQVMPGGPVRPAVVGFLVGMVPVIAFFVRLPRTVEPERRDGIRALLPIYLAGAVFFMVLHLNGSALTQWARDNTDRETDVLPSSFTQEGLPGYYVNAPEDTPRPDPRTLIVVDNEAQVRMYGQQRLDAAAVEAIAAAAGDDTAVVRFTREQQTEAMSRRAASEYATGVVSVGEGDDGHGGKVVQVSVAEGASAVGYVAFERTVDGRSFSALPVTPAQRDAIYGGYQQRYGHAPVTLPPGQLVRVANAELYQSFNALFVVAFTPLVVGFFTAMARKGRGATTARKMYLGLVFTTLSLVWMAVAGALSDGGAVKVGGVWLVGFYAIVTVGELCLSPMGLSLVTKLAPPHLVGLAMGGWFMATAFGNNFSGFFGGIQSMLSPTMFFSLLAAIAALAALAIRAMLPWLDRTIASVSK